MSVSVTLPELGESVTEGTVTRWLKQVGDSVAADEPLLEVSTDKVDTEIPSPTAGTLLSITAEEDQTVEVGAELGVIGEQSEVAASDGGSAGGGDSSTSHEGDSEDEAEPSASDAHAGDDERSAPAPSGHSTAAEVPGGQSGSLPADEADPPAEGDSHDDRLREQAAGSGGSGPGGSGGSGSRHSVMLPELGESVTEGTVTRWLKQVGDSVAADEPLLEVSTDKVDTEIPSPTAGTLLSITAEEDQTVEVGAELGVIGEPSDTEAGQPEPGAPDSEAPDSEAPDSEAPDSEAPDSEAPDSDAPDSEARSPEAPATEAPEREQAVRPPAAPEPARQPAEQASGPTPDAPVPTGITGAADGASPYVTPLVRKLAAQHDVDLSAVSGSGVGGRIRKQDVLDAAEAARAAAAQAAAAERGQGGSAAAQPSAPGGTARGPAQPSPLRGTTQKMSRLRSVIASRMVQSLQTSAQLTTVVEVDVTVIAALRQRAKAGFEQREGVRLSFLPFFALATVETLKVMPTLNATLDTDAGQVSYGASENLGIAVDTERGLLVPVIADAGDLNLAGLARRIADLAARTRTNKVSPDELAGGTFTLTNTGSRGALFDTPILNQPQVGILGTGAVVRRPMVVNAPGIGETIAIRSMAYLSLTYDHRLVDGADAARFLVAVKNRLEEGAFEAELGL